VIFHELTLPGAFRIEPERIEDSRGFFARAFCAEAFAEHGLDPTLRQCSLSFNRQRGTLRGLHYQTAPWGEAKLVRCTRGRIFDVIVDLRPDSATRGRWEGVELAADNHGMVYAPEGFAHGFQTLEDDSELFYQMSAPYRAEAAAGVRWDDPDLAISWPLPAPILSERDRRLPRLREIVERKALAC
jgi:dTDP-4-dehydrorhamnose 3,5-epimerase